MILPSLIILNLLIIYPLIQAFYLSLTNQRIGVPGAFVGFKNYVELLKQDIFLKTLMNSGLYVSVSLALKTIFGLLLALILNSLPRGRALFRAIVLLPWVVPASMSVLVWQWMFDPTFSVLNWILVHVGLNRINWLGNPFWAKVSVITINVWRGIPFFAIALGAGLVAIPKELYESASIDGAGIWVRFSRITLPLLRPVLGIVVLYSLVMTLADFEIVYILTRGGPMQSTHLLGTLSYQIGLAGTKISLGAAISLFLFPILLFSALFALRIILRYEEL